MAELTQLSLIERAQKSPEDEAWVRISEIYEPFIAGYLYRSGVREPDADDIKQEVMQVIFRELPKFEHNQRTGAFRTWLRNIIANRLRTFRRGPAQREQGVGGSVYMQLANEFADSTGELSKDWDREHDEFVVKRLVSSVAERFNSKTIQAFEDTYLHEHSIDDVAAKLGLSVNAVVLARSRVLRALREIGHGMID